MQCRTKKCSTGAEKLLPAPAALPVTRLWFVMSRQYTCHQRIDKGFTLLEVLVALVIIGTALSASLRAVASLTQNSGDLRAAMMATWSAENRLTQIRLAREWPSLGQRRFDCPQGELPLLCEEHIYPTPNPAFRRVEVAVMDGRDTSRRIIMLSQIVPNAL
jgi:general secretion pathway protein I